MQRPALAGLGFTAFDYNKTVRVQLVSIAVAGLLATIAAGPPGAVVPTQDPAARRRIIWDDTVLLRARLEASGLTAAAFPSFVDRVHQTNARRVHEGDLDHLVFYMLQSTRLSPLPAIEPALSAKAFVESLDPSERAVFLRDGQAMPARVSVAVRTRIAALTRAIEASTRDARLQYFRHLVTTTFPDRREREAALTREYLRVMRFVYEKEFVALRSPRGPDAVAALYRTRGLSTDTALEAGYVVHNGLGVLKSLEPDRRVRRVLIVGPGLDLAPRTALTEAGPPQSYQPWAVMDALVSLGLSRVDDLHIVGGDINPRVVEYLRRARTAPPTLTLVSEIRDSTTVRLSDDYRHYVSRLGRVIGEATADPSAGATPSRTVRISPSSARTLQAATLDVVTDRLVGAGFDLVIATNILPYFDDVELMLAMSNIAAMLVPGGVFLHNEPRPVLGDVTAALGLPFEQSRHVIIASVSGALRPGSGQAPVPLGDSVFLHRREASR